MIINPQNKLKENLFYNNICLIVCIFCIICLATSIFYENSLKKEQGFFNLKENSLYGPIKITNQNAIYKITAHFNGIRTSTYISGEVLDENKDTLYEFGKDLWHEEGYDSEGHWSESDRYMYVYLTFSEKGTYYIQFRTEEGLMQNISLKFQLLNGSYVAHYEIGTIFFILILIMFYITNTHWIHTKFNELKEAFEDD